MANHKSAEKRARQSSKRRQRNQGVKNQLRTAVRTFRATLGTAGAAEGSAEQLAEATKLLRKARSKGVLHPKTASRRVSRLVRAFNKSAAAATSA